VRVFSEGFTWPDKIPFSTSSLTYVFDDAFLKGGTMGHALPLGPPAAEVVRYEIRCDLSDPHIRFFFTGVRQPRAQYYLAFVSTGRPVPACADGHNQLVVVGWYRLPASWLVSRDIFNAEEVRTFLDPLCLLCRVDSDECFEAHKGGRLSNLRCPVREQYRAKHGGGAFHYQGL
jgi:hypothetical protein